MSMQPWAAFVKEAFDKSLLVAKFFCTVHVTNTYLCTFALINGPSMLPTFDVTGAFVLADKISTRFGKVGNGDIVLFRSPEMPRKIAIKRVIGMEGDTVTYLVDPENSDVTKSIVVPKGCVWIEGDNIYNSRDSRDFGPIPYGLLHGRVFWNIWPPVAFGSVRRKAQSVDPVL